jgi:hypothetical protein
MAEALLITPESPPKMLSETPMHHPPDKTLKGS